MSFLSNHQTSSALAIFAILIAIFYGNTLQNGFVFDDKSAIEQNENLRSLGNIHKVITGCLQEVADGGCRETPYQYYRPVQHLLVFLTYQVSSAPWFFHLLNLFYFFAAVALIFIFAKLLTRNFFTAVLSGVFFIVHPLNSSVANYVSAGPELTFLIFSLLAVIFYLRHGAAKKGSSFWPVYAFYTLALFSKEPALMLPIVFLALDILFFRVKPRAIFKKENIIRYLTFGIPAIAYFVVRGMIMGLGVTGAFAPFGFLEGMYARVVLFAQYIEKFFFPYPLSIVYPFEKSSQFISLEFFVSVIVSVSFFCAFSFLLKTRRNILAFSFLWFFLFIFPVIALLIGESEHMFADRFAFVSGVGFVLGFAHIISSALTGPSALQRFPAYRYVIAGLIVAIVVSSWILVFDRNKDWKSQEMLYVSALEHYPDAHETRRNVGEIYFLRGDIEEARVEFEYLIQNAPAWRDITMAYKGLGDYWRAKGDLDKALEYYIQSTQTAPLNPRDFVPFNDAGMIYMEEKKEPLLALTYFCQSLSLFPTEQTQQNFDKALSLVEENPQSITDTFSPAPTQNIKYLDTRCEKGSCQHAMALNPANKDVILPMLITASDTRNRSVDITNQSFDPQQSVIIIETDIKYEDEDLTFLFPTCSRTYYEVKTRE